MRTVSNILMALQIVFAGGCAYFAEKASEAYETGQTVTIWFGLFTLPPDEANTTATTLTACCVFVIVCFVISVWIRLRGAARTRA
jgi:hypothetical protein